MNIQWLYASNALYSDFHAHNTSTTEKKQTTVQKSQANYDKVTIQHTQTPISESSFANLLAKETASKANESVPQERVLSLQHQVSAGTYQPDARRIAQKMLGYY